MTHELLWNVYFHFFLKAASLVLGKQNKTPWLTQKLEWNHESLFHLKTLLKIEHEEKRSALSWYTGIDIRARRVLLKCILFASCSGNCNCCVMKPRFHGTPEYRYFFELQIVCIYEKNHVSYRKVYVLSRTRYCSLNVNVRKEQATLCSYSFLILTWCLTNVRVQRINSRSSNWTHVVTCIFYIKPSVWVGSCIIASVALPV